MSTAGDRGSQQHDGYVSALSGRYASKRMQSIWSNRHKYETWRKIWLAAAEAQHEMGLPVTAEQVAELRSNLDVTDADIARASELEAELRHDVMSHVHAWGERCPQAKGIIHLGMTSQDINDNCELLLLWQAMQSVFSSYRGLQNAMASAAERWRAVPTLAFTHYQVAQPTTVGRRVAQWSYDLSLSSWDIFEGVLGGEEPRLRGLRGATGTQASFLRLFDGDAEQVAQLETRFLFHLRRLNGDDFYESVDEAVESTREMARELGEEDLASDAEAWRLAGGLTFQLTGQTFPRVTEASLLHTLASICSVLHKTATDIRLLSNRKEMDEPFEKDQIGSSAMPYKRNPMRCERVCGLARFVMNLVGNAYETAAVQWLERTLDDSANRRLTLPEAFLATDACLNIMTNVIDGLVVHEAQVRKNLMTELPFLATENILMEAVKAGGDRQELHEVIRQHSQEVAWAIKQEGKDNDLLDRLRDDPAFDAIKDRLTEGDLLDPMKYVGLAVEQTERYVEQMRDVLESDDEDADAAEPEALRV